MKHLHVISLILSLFSFSLLQRVSGQGSAAPMTQSPVYTAATFKEDDGILYVSTSSDGLTFNEVSELYQDSAPLRDPTIIYYYGKYWCAYTLGDGATSGAFGLASSSDGISWIKVGNISVSIPLVLHIWAPSWFINPSDGSLHLILNCNTSSNLSFAPYEMHPTNSGMTSWSASTLITGNIAFTVTDMIDCFMEFINGTYYLWYKNDSSQYIELASSSSPFSGYTKIKTGDWNGWGHGNITGSNHGYEAPCALQLTNGTWILYVDSSVSQGIVYSTSPDGLHGWSPFKPATFNNPNGCTMSGPDIRQMAIVTPPVQSPALQIELSGTNVVLSWPWVPPGGLVLETATDLTATNGWTTVSNLPPFRGIQYTATNQVCGASRFYRVVAAH